jgi:hypothetical protein
MSGLQAHTSEKGICDFDPCPAPALVQWQFEQGVVETCAHHARSVIYPALMHSPVEHTALWIETATPFDDDNFWSAPPLSQNDDEDAESNHV